jgi:hypothetical protein
MPHSMDSARQDLNALYADALTPDHFRKWRSGAAAVAVLNAYAVGEIRWRKSLGRPETMTLSEAFILEASQEQWMQVPSDPGTVKFDRMLTSRHASWWDGKDDDEHWRVAFLVGGLVSGQTVDPANNLYTHIVPSLKGASPWTHPGGSVGISTSGYRIVDPPGAHFVKGTEIVHLAFEVVIRPWWRFDSDGIGNP